MFKQAYMTEEHFSKLWREHQKQKRKNTWEPFHRQSKITSILRCLSWYSCFKPRFIKKYLSCTPYLVIHINITTASFFFFLYRFFCSLYPPNIYRVKRNSEKVKNNGRGTVSLKVSHGEQNGQTLSYHQSTAFNWSHSELILIVFQLWLEKMKVAGILSKNKNKKWSCTLVMSRQNRQNWKDSCVMDNKVLWKIPDEKRNGQKYHIIIFFFFLQAPSGWRYY